MSDSRNEVPDPLPSFAARWLAQRRLGFARLDALQRQELRQMTERESARIFSQLDPPRPYELRPSSGLVEQQRWFRLFREKRGNDQTDSCA